MLTGKMRSHCKNKVGVRRQLEVAEGPEGFDNDFAKMAFTDPS